MNEIAVVARLLVIEICYVLLTFIHKDMLKLTNSFYRYITVKCERLIGYKTHVRKYSHLSHIIEISHSTASHIDLNLRRQFKYCSILQKHSSYKKNRKIKISPLNIDELERTEKMTDKSKHATYGGTFVVSSDDDSPAEEESKKSTSKSKKSKVKRKIPHNIRQWDSMYKEEMFEPDSFSFKVVSYNVLAQCLLEFHPHLYAECSPNDLDWNVRSARLFDEIVALAPDILCLQEVQASHLSSFYSKLEKMGYLGVFKQKTGQKLDGCAIYYRKTLFALDDHISVEYNQPNLPILNRDNIGLIVKLTPKLAPHTTLVVATTHLLYNPAREDVRLAQMQLFLAEIDRFAFFQNGTLCGHFPIILTGDFNAEPSSVVSKLVREGCVNTADARDDSDWEQIGITDNCQHLSVYLDRRAGRRTEFTNLKIFNTDYCRLRPKAAAPTEGNSPGPFNLLFNSGELWHALQLYSVYDCAGTVNEATTYQDRWVMVDYMYYSCKILKLTHRLRLPLIQDCKLLKRLPNEVYASDHLALAAVFKISWPRN